MKKLLHQIHLWLGLSSGIVVVVVAITGCLYVFEDELRDVFESKYLYVKNVGAERKNLAEINAKISMQYPKETITQIRFSQGQKAAYIFLTNSKKAISINPYTLEIMGVRNIKNDFFRVVLDIHKTLLLGNVGKQIIRFNVLIFFILCVSGLVLWWPKQKQFFKRAVSINFKTKNYKRLNWDLHSVLGFYALFVLFIISLTGLFWVFDSAKWVVSKATNSPITKNEKVKSKPIGSKAFSMADAYAASAVYYPNATETIISNPAEKDAPIRVVFRYPYAIVRKQNALFFDKYSGKILKEDLYKNCSNYDVVARSNYDFHTGGIPALGIGSKIVFFLASFFAGSLPITGFIIWWGKYKKKRKGNALKAKTAIVPQFISTSL